MPAIYRRGPTLQGVYLKDVEQAKNIIAAVYLGKLPLVSRRLDSHERQLIQPGNIYVWEVWEHGGALTPESGGIGMERWYIRSMLWSENILTQLIQLGLMACIGGAAKCNR